MSFVCLEKQRDSDAFFPAGNGHSVGYFPEIESICCDCAFSNGSGIIVYYVYADIADVHYDTAQRHGIYASACT